MKTHFMLLYFHPNECLLSMTTWTRVFIREKIMFLKMKNKKNYASFRIPILKHFIKHKPIISEECNQLYNIFSKDQGLMILVTFSKFF